MNSLKNAWKKMQFKMAACDMLDPPPAVMDVMKKDGWSFETRLCAPPSARVGMPTSYSYVQPKTPEGQYVFAGDDNKNYERYCKARIAAAKQVYGMK